MPEDWIATTPAARFSWKLRAALPGWVACWHPGCSCQGWETKETRFVSCWDAQHLLQFGNKNCIGISQSLLKSGGQGILEPRHIANALTYEGKWEHGSQVLTRQGKCCKLQRSRRFAGRGSARSQLPDSLWKSHSWCSSIPPLCLTSLSPCRCVPGAV